MKRFKKIILSILLAIIIGILILAMNKEKPTNTIKNNNQKQIVVSNFACYDFLRAIIGDTQNIQLTFLLGPGKEAHSYEPTAQDLIKINKSNLFVYVGGELEPWSQKVSNVMKNNNKNLICICDYIELIEENEEEHTHEDHEHVSTFDSHIWTSPNNAIKMVEILEKEVEKIDAENEKKYKENSEKYIESIKNVQQEIQNIVDQKQRNILVFGDKMPMQYFIKEYNLEVESAFNGCSTETDPSSAKIAYLADKVRDENIPVVLYCELGTGKIANVIASEAGNGAQIMQIQTLHNISKNDFQNGETWVSLMTKNLEVLKKALQ